MDTRLLKMFCAVADSGSLVKAAGKLHLTSSALSHGLKGLETELGCRLFERVGKKLLLNQAGEQLLAQVRPALSALDAAAESVKRLSQWGQTRLRVGAPASACQHIVPGVIREMKKTYPQLQMQVGSGDTPELVERLQDNQLDLVLGIAPPNPNGLESRAVFRDEMMLVFAPSHPWAAGRPVNTEDLRKQSFILYQRTTSTSQMVEDYFERLNIAPSTMMEIGSIEAIKELVKLNLGVSVLAPWTAHAELAKRALRMRPLPGQSLRRNWVMLSLAGRRLSLAEETFCRLCRSQAAGMRLDRKDVAR